MLQVSNDLKMKTYLCMTNSCWCCLFLFSNSYPVLDGWKVWEFSRVIFFSNFKVILSKQYYYNDVDKFWVILFCILQYSISINWIYCSLIMLEHVGQFLGITVGQDLQGQGMQKSEEEHQRNYKFWSLNMQVIIWL